MWVVEWKRELALVRHNTVPRLQGIVHQHVISFLDPLITLAISGICISSDSTGFLSTCLSLVRPYRELHNEP